MLLVVPPVLQDCWWWRCGRLHQGAHLLQVQVPAQQVCIAQQLPQLTGLQGPAVAVNTAVQQSTAAHTAHIELVW